MIITIRHKALKQCYETGVTKGLQQIYVDKIRRILFKLDDAQSPEEMDLPGYRLHSLTGDLKGYWSVTVGANWRIIFRFENSNVTDVDLVDYH